MIVSSSITTASAATCGVRKVSSGGTGRAAALELQLVGPLHWGQFPVVGVAKAPSMHSTEKNGPVSVTGLSESVQLYKANSPGKRIAFVSGSNSRPVSFAAESGFGISRHRGLATHFGHFEVSK